ncbi:MAG: rRNA pseudouridine synthase [Desulforudis sp.]|nr:MAG: rRNA pseudouridine synthase [Desulforudis sp.]
MPVERLQKILARAGLASRRHSEEIILAGRVSVNGKIVRELGVKADPSRDDIRVDGKPVRSEDKVYLLLYKPRGYVTTTSDPQSRRKVTDLLGGLSQRVFPVGRLDYDSEGLLLLTNDGNLSYVLTHPKFHLPKTYQIQVEGIPGADVLERFRSGIDLDDGPTAAARVRVLRSQEAKTLVEMTIFEGKNRLIRRMWEAVGHPVIRLKRTRFANLTLRGLRPGAHRELTSAELAQLRGIVENRRVQKDFHLPGRIASGDKIRQEGTPK